MRCHEIVQSAFESWNDPESNRRLNKIQLLTDVPEDYEPQRQIRPNTKKRQRSDYPTNSFTASNKPKKPKASAIKYANRCGRAVSSDDPMQINAILCCHQDEYFDWIDEQDSCRRWLCNFCRIKSAIPTDTKSWFCDEHEEMHEEANE